MAEPGRPVRRVIFDHPFRVAMRGGVVVVQAADGVHVSRDRGRTFTLATVPEPCDSCGGVLGAGIDLAVTARGTVIIADTEINTCGSSDLLEWMRVLRLEGDRFVATGIVMPTEADYAASFHVGAHGWLYGVSYAHRLIAWGDGGATAIHAIPFADQWPVLAADNGALTLAIVGRDLVELRATRARVLTSDVRDHISDLAVDGRGRALVVTDRGLERFSRARGWELVLAHRGAEVQNP
jgi:hypothetical protein